MANGTLSWFSSSEGLAVLWFGILAGPIAWATDLGVSYALVKWTCGSQHTMVLHLISVAALVIIGAGAFGAWQALDRASHARLNRDISSRSSYEMARQRPSNRHAETIVQSIERSHFMAALGLLSCALFATVVIATAIPKWILDACQ